VESPTAVAVVSVNETSEPPGRYERNIRTGQHVVGGSSTSVIHCPEVKAKAGSRLIRRGSRSSFIFGEPESSMTLAVPSVMLIGQNI